MVETLEIGRSLREARLARGLTLETLESRTKIRVRYLDALEHERYDELPGEAYARAFLRTYAEQLGLDGHELLEAYRERRRASEEVQVAPRPQRPYEPRRAWPALAVLAAAALLVALSLAAWRLGTDGGGTATRPPARAAAPAVAVVSATAPAPLDVRLSNADGRRVWSGTLRPGRPLRLGLGRRLWLRSSTPRRLRLLVAGDTLRLPARTALLSRSGVDAL